MVENMFTLIAQYIRRMSISTGFIYITIKEKNNPYDDIAFSSFCVKNHKMSDIIDKIYNIMSNSLDEIDEFSEFEFYHYQGNIYIHIIKL